ncbi:hypothetical protein KC19_VG132400 [Ceratodon purpureus]|uniref:CCHC-type domain-containing protein n=1 Tax=Ceratodon purpureus TaxID=3225 RepID=A0A8T0HQ32_CERPU|nr:hypothetical protein KC19_VG132400 [Ceratodon purpureus]
MTQGGRQQFGRQNRDEESWQRPIGQGRGHSINELKKRTQCNYCRQKGHWEKECQKKLTHEGTSGANITMAEPSSVFIVATEQSAESFNADSGCSYCRMSGHCVQCPAGNMTKNTLYPTCSRSTVLINSSDHWHDHW